MIFLALYLTVIVAANFAVEHWGIVPVGFGLMAPAGVYFAGLGFTLRDLTHETLGRWGVLAAIVAGSALSAWVSPQLAVAAGVAFLVSEFADFAVYAPMRERNWLAAVFASNVVGLTLDSALFLYLAFGNLDFFLAQVVGKGWMTALAIVLLWKWRESRDLPVRMREERFALRSWRHANADDRQ